MGSSRLSVRFVQGFLLLFVPPTVMAGGIFVLLYSLEVHHHPAALVATLLVGVVTMVTYLAFMVHGMAESLVAMLREMQLDTELMATVDPAHRLLIQTGDELESLAETINRLGERLSAAQDTLSSAVSHATEEATTERRFLADVLEAAGAAIAVLAADGRVGLANAAARALLAPEGSAIVGRNLSDLVEGEDTRHLVNRPRGRRVADRVLLRRSVGTTLEAVVAMLPSGDGREGGFILVIREAVPPTRSGAYTRSETADLGSRRKGETRARAVGLGARSPAGAAPVPRLSSLYDSTLFTARVGRGERADRERPIVELDCVVFDSESTGFDHDGQDRIVSLAGVRVRGGAVRREDIFDALVNPRRPIPPASTALHGVTDAMVADAPPIDVILPEFLRFTRGAVLAGHKVWFDLRFLDRESLRLGLSPFEQTHAVLDTLLLARLVNESLEDLGLDGISRRLGVNAEGRHSALGDALTTAEIYVRLLELLRNRGIVTLGQTLDAVARLQDTTAD